MHEIALGYIAQIRELLDTLEQTTGMDVEEFRRELPNWTAMVLTYPSGWSQAVQFDETSLRFLKTLAPLLNGLVPKYTDEDVQRAKDGLTELLELLSKETTIPRSLSIYLLNLINHVRWVLHDYHIQGDFQLARATTLLRDTITTAGDASTDKELKPWYTRLRELFARKEVVDGTIALGTAAAKAVAAIEMGGGL